MSMPSLTWYSQGVLVLDQVEPEACQCYRVPQHDDALAVTLGPPDLTKSRTFSLRFTLEV